MKKQDMPMMGAVKKPMPMAPMLPKKGMAAKRGYGAKKK